MNIQYDNNSKSTGSAFLVFIQVLNLADFKFLLLFLTRMKLGYNTCSPLRGNLAYDDHSQAWTVLPEARNRLMFLLIGSKTNKIQEHYLSADFGITFFQTNLLIHLLPGFLRKVLTKLGGT